MNRDRFSRSPTPSRRRGRIEVGVAILVLVLLFLAALRVTRSAPLPPAEFSFNNGAEVSTLDPATISSVPEGRIVRALFEGLCVKDPRTLEALPGMAETWEVSADGRTYTFHLREEARWSNGDPVTAEDFLYSWRRVLDPATAAEYAYILWYVRGARQYTGMPDELLFASGDGSGLWIEELGDGRVRLGLTGHALETVDPEVTVELPATVAAGERIEAGEPLGVLGLELRLPFAALVTELNPDLPPTAKGLLEDPYGDGWILEASLEADRNLEAAREAGRLLEGARYRREVVETELLGLRALDPRTFEVELERPTPYFLDLVGFYPLYPVNRRNLEEARARWPGEWRRRWLAPENLVTNGPYRIGFRRINDRIRLVKNPTYWDAENVALETIDAFAIDHLGTSLNLYLTGELDWIDRPVTDVIPLLKGREDFHVAPFLGTYFYRVNTTRPPFDDRRVRRALALAIDRLAIVEKITRAGEPVAFGLTTEGVGDGYPRVRMASSGELAIDLEEAKQLLAEAGYGPDGAEFPTFEILFNTDQVHRDIAEVIADGWQRHLGLRVKLLNQEWKVYLDSQKTFRYDVVRASWIGDYPDPNTFLDVFVTGGENNRTGWGNDRYDQLIAEAARELEVERRFALLAEAEAILLEELPILPIYHYVSRNLVDPRLGGFHENIRDEHFCKFWYWIDDRRTEERR